MEKLGIAGAFMTPVSLLSQAASPASTTACSDVQTIVQRLEGPWEFTLDPGRVGESKGWHLSSTATGGTELVTVPHTWQIDPTRADYQGAAWYRKWFTVPQSWAGKMIRLQFEAVTHTATVWMGTQLLGEHLGKGYTAFTFDISSQALPGGAHFLAVKVENPFNPDMLPRGKSFDWAPDGGIIRPVNLVASPQLYIDRLFVDTQPNLEGLNSEVHVSAVVRNASKEPAWLRFDYQVQEEDSGQVVAFGTGGPSVHLQPGEESAVHFDPITARLRLWHFDHPHLYRISVQLKRDRQTIHNFSETFGARKFEAKDGGFYLNGERVRLMGVERMAGSNPNYGMAEPSSWIAHDHDDLKELNCVFTRVHWQQDKRVLDYCDRHGILLQEEVPAWGPDTFKGTTNEPSPEIMQNGLEQLREMIARDYNHPSIFAWGLCNEVDGQNPPAQVFIRRMAEEARRLDPRRLLTYASNSLQTRPEEDAAGSLDFISWNEYYESWYGGNTESVRRNLREIHSAFSDKPIVISEYGYCECTPERVGGDERRIEILRNHTNVYREFDFVAGAIFFDYNDYRTHVGDKGMGVLKQRVHGVVDLYGNCKPSFDALRQESSPVESLQLVPDADTLRATVVVRKSLPAYTLEGYTLRWIVFGFDDLPMEQGSTRLPELHPGEQLVLPIRFELKNPRRVRADVTRPTGFSAFTAWWTP